MNKIIFNDDKVKWIAHRGLSSKYLENTNEAFEAAAKLPFYGIETDVHLTKDQVFILHHDDDLTLVDGSKVLIKEHNYEELNALFNKTHNHKLPLLKEYLNTCKTYKKVAFVEIKPKFTYDEVKYLVETIDKYITSDLVNIISYHVDCLNNVKQFNKDIKTQVLLWKDAQDKIDDALLEDFDLDIVYYALNEEMVKKIKDANKLLNVWTVNNEPLAQSMIDLGADFITTDGF